MVKTYRIFGKVVQINLLNDENKIQKDIIIRHFSLYDELDGKQIPDLIINIHKQLINNDIQSINPQIHIEIKNGFVSLFPKVSVAFRDENCLTADVSLDFQKRGFIKYLKKLYNIQYNSTDQRISQILHELILVPSVYFDSNHFLVHSSAFKKNKGGAILIGGTGGVGKTSLEIELCMNRGYSFIADDISVVDDTGSVWPNLSFPKIYAYNLKNNNKLKNRIFENRSLFDKFAWKFKYFLNGSAGVRRNISPVKAFGKFEKEPINIDKYIILVKHNVEKISIKKIDPKQASEMTVKIIQAEYAQFNNHILWHEFNRKAVSSEPIVCLENVLSSWGKQSEKVFKSVDCYLINIPLNIEHKKFVTEVADLIE